MPATTSTPPDNQLARPSLPASIRVAGRNITIAYGSESFKDSGEMCEEQLSITIKAGQLPIEEADTLLHEAIHGLDYLYNLKLTEHQVRVLATSLLGVFQDNPEFTQFVTRKMT